MIPIDNNNNLPIDYTGEDLTGIRRYRYCIHSREHIERHNHRVCREIIVVLLSLTIALIPLVCLVIAVILFNIGYW